MAHARMNQKEQAMNPKTTSVLVPARTSARALALAAALLLPAFSAAAAPFAGGASMAAAALAATAAPVMLGSQNNPAAQVHTMVLRVRDLRTGAPIVGARVTGFWQTGQQTGPLPTAVTNADGVAIIVGPKAVHWKMTVTQPGYPVKNFTRFGNSNVDRHEARMSR